MIECSQARRDSIESRSGRPLILDPRLVAIIAVITTAAHSDGAITTISTVTVETVNFVSDADSDLNVIPSNSVMSFIGSPDFTAAAYADGGGIVAVSLDASAELELESIASFSSHDLNATNSPATAELGFAINPGILRLTSANSSLSYSILVMAETSAGALGTWESSGTLTADANGEVTWTKSGVDLGTPAGGSVIPSGEVAIPAFIALWTPGVILGNDVLVIEYDMSLKLDAAGADYVEGASANIADPFDVSGASPAITSVTFRPVPEPSGLVLLCVEAGTISRRRRRSA